MKLSKKLKIVCLPPVSNKNPYQYLMMEGLKKNKKLHVITGFSSRYIGIILSAIIFRPNYIHFDWINKYYLKKNAFISSIYIPWFFFQIFFITKIMKINVVWTMHNLLPHDSKQIKINKYVQRFFINKCKWIRVFSHLTIPKVLEEYKIKNEKILAIPEGSYVGYYPNNISEFEARKKMGLEKEKTFLYLGTIKPYKGITNLIKNFSKIRKDNVKLIIAGKVTNSDYLYKINKCINNNSNIILINRFIKTDELQVFFNSADAVILPFNNIENSGSAILAMGFAKVIICPNLGVLPNRLKKQTEFLYENDFIMKIKKVLDTDKIKLSKIGKMNLNELKKYKWSDFGNYFLN
tara:strand:+ start:1298 stop:2347 length:1050 start_codon:yes stop_codon:yes gene_type:complete